MNHALAEITDSICTRGGMQTTGVRCCCWLCCRCCCFVATGVGDWVAVVGGVGSGGGGRGGGCGGGVVDTIGTCSVEEGSQVLKGCFDSSEVCFDSTSFFSEKCLRAVALFASSRLACLRPSRTCHPPSPPPLYSGLHLGVCMYLCMYV